MPWRRPAPGPAPGPLLRVVRGPRAAMGLGVGGSMRQEVYRDDRPLKDWAEQPAGRVFVHLVTPPEWRRITGEAPPPSPVDRAAYTRAGLPWYDYYDQDAEDLAPTDALEGVQPVGDWLGDDHEPWQEPVAPPGEAAGGRAGQAGRGRRLVGSDRPRRLRTAHARPLPRLATCSGLSHAKVAVPAEAPTTRGAGMGSGAEPSRGTAAAGAGAASSARSRGRPR